MTDLREAWFRPGPELADRLRDEAIREIKRGHELDGVGLTCIARCSGCDDTVFRCDDGSFAVVHLTWQSNERPPWPHTVRVGSHLGLELVMDQHEHRANDRARTADLAPRRSVLAAPLAAR